VTQSLAMRLSRVRLPVSARQIELCYTCYMHGSSVVDRARKLRSLGMSLRDIATRLGIAKSTASLWLRDTRLSEDQQAALLQRDPKTWPGRLSRQRGLERTARWNEEAEALWAKLKNEPLFVFGVGLYWGEGSKTQKALSISNSDADLISRWMAWCRRYLPEHTEQRVRIMAHDDVDEQAARRFWKKVTGVEVQGLTRLPRRGSQKRLMRYGVVRVEVKKGAAEWSTKMMRWLQLSKEIELTGA
jgi:hypothetical protein